MVPGCANTVNGGTMCQQGGQMYQTWQIDAWVEVWHAKKCSQATQALGCGMRVWHEPWAGVSWRSREVVQVAHPALHHVLALGQAQVGLHGMCEGKPGNVAGGMGLPGGTYSVALEHLTHWTNIWQ